MDDLNNAFKLFNLKLEMVRYANRGAEQLARIQHDKGHIRRVKWNMWFVFQVLVLIGCSLLTLHLHTEYKGWLTIPWGDLFLLWACWGTFWESQKKLIRL